MAAKAFLVLYTVHHEQHNVQYGQRIDVQYGQRLLPPIITNRGSDIFVMRRILVFNFVPVTCGFFGLIANIVGASHTPRYVVHAHSIISCVKYCRNTIECILACARMRPHTPSLVHNWEGYLFCILSEVGTM